MPHTILRELTAVETTGNVRVLYACEAGSRCWGLATDDSDYDVRYVYLRPLADYLRLEKTADTMDWKLDGELDIVGWDVCKLLRLLRGSNPSVFEWLGSAIVYCEDEAFQAVRDLAGRCFDPRACTHHYLGMAMKHNRRVIAKQAASNKLYLHTLRAILSAKWCLEERTPPPTSFVRLADTLLDPPLRPVVHELVAKKLDGRGKDPCPPIPELGAWIDNTARDLDDKVTALEAAVRVPWQDVDDVFLNMLEVRAPGA